MFSDGQFILDLSSNATLFGDAGGSNVDHKSLHLPSKSFVRLNNILEDESEEHQKLMHDALVYINAEGRVPPSDLWEYQVSLSVVFIVKTKLCSLIHISKSLLGATAGMPQFIYYRSSLTMSLSLPIPLSSNIPSI